MNKINSSLRKTSILVFLFLLTMAGMHERAFAQTKPNLPTIQAATALNSTSIRITWRDNSSNETGFTVSNGSVSRNVGANTTSYTWTGLAPNTYMCFCVKANNSAGSSAWSPYACTTTPLAITIPAAPTNVTATAISGTSIRVSWRDNSNNETGFTVSNGVTSVNVGANTTTYTWNGLTQGTYMCFCVKANNSAGSSAWSAYGCTTTPSIPAMPTNPTATAISSNTILVRWSDNSNNETGFTVSNGVTSVNVGANITSYNWSGLAPETYMCFTIKANNAAGSSNWCPYACTTTPPLVTIPAAPTNPTATALDPTSIRVTWTDNSNNETGFTVFNGVSSVNVPANTTSYIWGGLTQGTYMCFSITASNSAGSSAATSYACTTTLSGPTKITVKVLVLNFDPIIESRGGVRLHEPAGWNSPQALKDQYIQDIANASGNKVEFQIVDWQDLDEFPLYMDGFRYTDAYIDLLDAAKAAQWNWWDYPGWHGNESIDYNHYINTLNLPQRVESGEIDEVWMFGGSRFGYYESLMVGRTAFWCNSSPIVRSDCRNFVIMGFNYERGVGEMLEDLGHRTESILTHVYGRRATQPGGLIPMDASALNTWEKFEMTESIKSSFPGAKTAVGNIHWAPNSTADYDWGNTAYVNSTYEDWKTNYPNLTGATTVVNCANWGNGDIRLHHVWWFTAIPKAEGRDSNGYLHNWWYYITLKY